MKAEKQIAVILLSESHIETIEDVKPYVRRCFVESHRSGLLKPFFSLRAFYLAYKHKKKLEQLLSMQQDITVADEEERFIEALKEKLKTSVYRYQFFIAKKEQPPFIEQVVETVRASRPDEIIMLPLFPHYSKTNAERFFEKWRKQAKKRDLHVPTKYVCCYATDSDYIEAHIRSMFDIFSHALEEGTPRILFCAESPIHVKKSESDPYFWQIEQTAHAIVKELAVKELDYRICFFSLFGNHMTIQPSIEEEIKRAAIEKRVVIVVPLSHVMENIKTQALLDQRCRKLAEKEGITKYHRVPTLSTEPHFIEAITNAIKHIAEEEFHSADSHVANSQGKRICPKRQKACLAPIKKISSS